jgi:transposase-like protein
MLDFIRRRFDSDIILLCVRWYLAYPLSYRNTEELMLERGIEVDHTSVKRWILKYTPQCNHLNNIVES